MYAGHTSQAHSLINYKWKELRMNSQLVINKHIHMQIVTVRIYFQLLPSTIQQSGFKIKTFFSFAWQLLYFSDHCWFFKWKYKNMLITSICTISWKLQDLRRIECVGHKMPVSFFSTTSVQNHFLSSECVAR
jgi:hypothetical protein